MQTPHVTVLTAVRNGSRYLPETIASIRAQTFRDWEYIIVDDASEDDTCRVVEAASRDDSRIRLIRRSKSEGPFAAANEGLSQARGRFVVRTDADDISPPHRIDRQLRFLNAERRFRACISPWQSFDERGLIAGSVNRIPSGADSLRWYLLLRTFSSHSSLCIERAALQEIGGYFELPVAQDYRLVCDLSRRGWLGVVPEVLSYVRRHENRISGRNGL
ncbi:MAG TPA: glycosyltransferase family A protein, partial [Blastocatellia bacterium]|nr:glycosyltransferase family A protein [Blastocatellia bacterium]